MNFPTSFTNSAGIVALLSLIASTLAACPDSDKRSTNRQIEIRTTVVRISKRDGRDAARDNRPTDATHLPIMDYCSKVWFDSETETIQACCWSGYQDYFFTRLNPSLCLTNPPDGHTFEWAPNGNMMASCERCDIKNGTAELVCWCEKPVYGKKLDLYHSAIDLNERVRIDVNSGYLSCAGLGVEDNDTKVLVTAQGDEREHDISPCPNHPWWEHPEK